MPESAAPETKAPETQAHFERFVMQNQNLKPEIIDWLRSLLELAYCEGEKAAFKQTVDTLGGPEMASRT